MSNIIDFAAKMRANWDENKAKYNTQRRAAYAEWVKANAPKRRGRPPKAVEPEHPPAPLPEVAKPAEAAHAISVAAAQAPRVFGTAITIPAAVKTLWGVTNTKIVLRNDVTTWPCWCADRWYGDTAGGAIGALSDGTKARYISQFKRASRLAGLTPPDSTDARVLGRWLVGFGQKEPPIDIWKLIEIIATGKTLTQQAEYSKALLAILNATIMDIVMKNETKTQGFERAWRIPLIIQYWNKKGKAHSDAAREVAAHVSEKTRKNVVDWAQWRDRAALYIKEVLEKKTATVQELQTAAIIALYSQIPPIRWDWRRVKLGDAIPAPDEFGNFEKENVAVVEDGQLTAAYFKDFKNAKSFGAPIEIRLDSPPLVKKIMEAYYKKLPSGAVYLFPKNLTTKAGLNHEMAQKTISDIVADKSTEWFGKRFTNIPMRKSYVTYWHAQNPEITAKKLKDDMRQMHQDTAGTRLTYILEKDQVNVDNLLKIID